MSRRRGGFIARVAGLPAEAVQELQDPSLLKQARVVERELAELGRAREQLVDQLHDVMATVSPELRRRLLAIRRDSHNHRSLEAHSQRPEWQRVMELCPAGAEVLRRERRCRECEKQLAQSYDRARARAVDLLWTRLAEEPTFCRGLTLASSSLMSTYFKYRRRRQDLKGGKKRRFEQSVARYVSRGTLKPSPYSSLTPIVFGTLRDDDDPRLKPPAASSTEAWPHGLRWTSDRWMESSTPQVRRFVVEQLAAVWSRIPTVQARLRPAANGSTWTRDGKLVFLRPPMWQSEAGSTVLQLHPPGWSQVADDPLWHQILEAVTGAESWQAAVEDLSNGLQIEPGTAEVLLEKARNIGLVELLPAWHRDRLRLESCLLEALEDHGGPAPAARALAEVAGLEKNFHRADPQEAAGVVEQVDIQLSQAFESLAQASMLKAQKPRILKPRELYEDVHLLPWERPADQGLEMPAESAERILHSLGPWVAVAQLRSGHLDFLYSLGHRLRRTGHQRHRLLDVFLDYQGLWRQYWKSSRHDGPRTGLNPFRLPEIEHLNELRGQVKNELQRLFRDAPDGQISSRQVAAVAARIPSALCPPMAACAFVQSADDSGKLWVLNQMFEGTGRYSGRFVQLLSGAPRQRWLRWCRGREATDDSIAQELDLAWTQGDNLMSRPALRRLLLQSPGDAGPRQEDDFPLCRLSPRDLMVDLTPGREFLPRLTDLQGRPLIPLHLATGTSALLPPWLQFVSLFGRPEISFPQPQITWTEKRPGVLFAPRITMDNLVLRRARWKLQHGVVDPKSTPTTAFRRLASVLHQVGAPSRLFVQERIVFSGGETRWKPQYVDLSCPLWVEILLRVAAQGDVVLEEALPLPEHLPRSYDGRRRAIELQLDGALTVGTQARRPQSSESPLELRQ